MAVDEIRPYLREGDMLSRRHVGRSANDCRRLATDVHRREPQAVGVRVRVDREYAADDHVVPARARAWLVGGLDTGHGKAMRELFRREG